MVTGFVGFGISTSNDPGYVPAVYGVEEIDNLVDADFRLVLRKLSKRDTVTKLKVNVCHYFFIWSCVLLFELFVVTE